MPLHTLAEWYTAVLLLITGVSHLTAPREWVAFFKDLLARPWGGLALGLLYLIPSLPLLLVHNTWTLTPAVVVTILAWGWTIKGSLYLVWPAIPIKVARPHLDRPERFRIAGAAIILLGGAILLDLVRAGIA